MNQIVVDASTVGNVILSEVPQDRAEQLERLLSESELVEPPHWPIEIAGFVLKASRRKRIQPQDRGRARDSIAALIKLAAIEEQSRAIAAFDLAVEHHISLYDAAYLELALRRRLPLLTSDGPLAKAALAANASLIELP